MSQALQNVEAHWMSCHCMLGMCGVVLNDACLYLAHFKNKSQSILSTFLNFEHPVLWPSVVGGVIESLRLHTDFYFE